MDELDARVAELKKEYEDAQHLLKTERRHLKQASQNCEHVATARALVQTLAQSVQQEAHKQIASIVSKCLEAIYDDPYDFRIAFERKRGKTEARLHFVRDGNEVDPMEASGGGVVDVAAFALRLACLILSQPQLRLVEILDEPFKFVSAEYRPRVRALLLTLAQELGVQFVMVTHSQELRIGKVYEL